MHTSASNFVLPHSFSPQPAADNADNDRDEVARHINEWLQDQITEAQDDVMRTDQPPMTPAWGGSVVDADVTPSPSPGALSREASFKGSNAGGSVVDRWFSESYRPRVAIVAGRPPSIKSRSGNPF